MSERIKNILALGERHHELAMPAHEHELSELVSRTDFDLPHEYLEFLSLHNGGSGELPVQPCWYELWPAGEVIENNQDYEVVKYLTEFLAIGSNQGGELIYIDYRNHTKGNIVSIPLIPTDPAYANVITDSFESLIPVLGLKCVCQ
jgi:hypothetical protein